MKLWLNVLIATLLIGFCIAGSVWLNKFVYNKHYEITENDIEEMLEEVFLTMDVVVKEVSEDENCKVVIVEVDYKREYRCLLEYKKRGYILPLYQWECSRFVEI